jgi:curli biogenesis system outer membrane secretion channel CsgG
MNSRVLPLFLCLGALTACSGESTPTFNDPVAALDAGDSAAAAGNAVEARAAYEYAATNGDDAQKTDALIGLFELEAVKGGADRVVPNALIETGDFIVDYAVARNEGLASRMEKAVNGLELLKTEGPGADLSAVGYAGD